MNKLIIAFILLLYSCTKDKLTNNIQTNVIKTDKRSDYSKQLTNLLIDTKYVEDLKIQPIYNSIIKRIQPDMSKDSLKKVLQTIHYWDQIYRDSCYTKSTPRIYISDKIKLKKYKKKTIYLDEMNSRIVVHLLNNIGGWPDTKVMGENASMAIWLVILHNDERQGPSKCVSEGSGGSSDLFC